MRKLMLITAMVLVSATAQAGQTRSLTLAAADGQAAPADQAKPADATKTSEAATPSDTPKFVDRPSAVGTTTTPPATQPPTTDSAKPAPSQTAKAERPKHRQQYWTESRIIGELHRHGIYW
jgi:hypothetical protein